MSTKSETSHIPDEELEAVQGAGGRLEPIASRMPKIPGVDMEAYREEFGVERPKDDLAPIKEVEIHKPKRGL